MNRPGKKKPHGGNREASENTIAGTGNSEAEHTAVSADALIRRGVMLAKSGCDALALATDTPARGIVEACDCIAGAAQHLALSAGFSQFEESACGGGA